MLDRIPEDILNKFKLTENISNHIIKDMLTRIPENMPDRMPKKTKKKNIIYYYYYFHYI